jgi:SAM-dependent methyltransferase
MVDKSKEYIDPLNKKELEDLFSLKYGSMDQLGWNPRIRKKFNYYNPDDHYETLVKRLVTRGISWVDVGCGRNLFPSNKSLAKILSKKSSFLMGIDPAKTIHENPFVHDRAQVLMDDFKSDRTYDLITMRMVAEHVTDSQKLLRSIDSCTHPGSLVVIYTINRWSPVPIVTHLVPFSLHHPVKKFLWRSQEKDTFPTAYNMNTHKILTKLFSGFGFNEIFFEYLDDCRTFARFKFLLYFELSLRKLLNTVGLKYPENCLLAVYQKQSHTI